jgi:hypothetical protein
MNPPERRHILLSMSPRLRRAFLDHPHAVGESYAEHFAAASHFGLRLLGAGLACRVHALVPGWCTRSASRTVAGLAREMEARRAPRAYAVAGTAASASRSSGAASLHSLSRS